MVKNLQCYAEIEKPRFQESQGYVSVGDSKIYYETSGNPNGDWLVLIHGFGGSTQMWKKQLTDFNKHFKVLNFDLAGHGKSSAVNSEKYSAALQANHIRLLMDALKIEKAHILGISLGTTVQQNFAQMFPERILSLIYASPVGTPNYLTRFSNSFIGKIFFNVVSQNLFMKVFAKLCLPGKNDKKSRMFLSKLGASLARDEYKKWLRIAMQGDHTSYLTKSSIPTLVIAGREDYCFFNDTVQLTKKYLNCEFKVIENAGHVLIFQVPQEFNEIVIDYIDRYNKSASAAKLEQTTIAA